MAPWASADGLVRALSASASPACASGGSVPTGLLVGEWSNCALLSPLLAALTPCESVLDAEGVVVLDIPTAQLLRLADAEQQCEAIVDGPQCAPMRRRFVEAQLIIAVLNDNDDPEEACGSA